MYHTCMFCHSDLGQNEAVEHFPIGRRLAFDSAKGRLWVVCQKCARWSLTPVDERWEAIEECERLFSATRLRVSTDHVGLARVKEGLELVCIGSPQRPEFAAWRYGDQFGRRRRRHRMYVGVGVATAAAAIVTGPLVMGLAVGTAFSLVNTGRIFFDLSQQQRIRARIAVPGKDRPAVVRGNQMGKIRIVSDGDAWYLRMPYDRGILIDKELKREVTLEGDAALRAAATILAISNQAGASGKQLKAAVDLVTMAPETSRLFLQATRRTWRIDQGRNRWIREDREAKGLSESPLSSFPAEMLLALEMSAHEDVERRALEGELSLLEEAWRQAEEIAQIADNLTVPESTEQELKKLRDGRARSEAD
jgi:hypothetical protein